MLGKPELSCILNKLFLFSETGSYRVAQVGSGGSPDSAYRVLGLSAHRPAALRLNLMPVISAVIGITAVSIFGTFQIVFHCELLAFQLAVSHLFRYKIRCTLSICSFMTRKKVGVKSSPFSRH